MTFEVRYTYAKSDHCFINPQTDSDVWTTHAGNGGRELPSPSILPLL